jgi:hypothetical protein
MNPDDPYLSIVAVSRNDDHGGGLLQRMQHFIDCLHEQVTMVKIPVELVLVEWNPPPDRLSLGNSLSWPVLSRYFSVRIITVPREVHKRFANSEKIPLFQMIGKNAGIRRAKGRFVLATNIDIILSDEMVRYLAQKDLEPGYFYRADRIDVEPDIPAGKSTGEKLEYCRTHVIRVNSQHFLVNFTNIKALAGDILKNPGLAVMYFRDLPVRFGIPRLHYNACGDFTLMAREDWDAMRGYPELEIFSLHIDSLFLMAAYFSGFREIVLPSSMAIFHIEHSIGSGITPGRGQRALFRRLDEDGIPYLSWRDCVTLALGYKERMTGGNGTVLYNDESWGLAGLDLPEIVPTV